MPRQIRNHVPYYHPYTHHMVSQYGAGLNCPLAVYAYSIKTKDLAYELASMFYMLWSQIVVTRSQAS